MVDGRDSQTGQVGLFLRHRGLNRAGGQLEAGSKGPAGLGIELLQPGMAQHQGIMGRLHHQEGDVLLVVAKHEVLNRRDDRANFGQRGASECAAVEWLGEGCSWNAQVPDQDSAPPSLSGPGPARELPSTFPGRTGQAEWLMEMTGMCHPSGSLLSLMGEGF